MPANRADGGGSGYTNTYVAPAKPKPKPAVVKTAATGSSVDPLTTILSAGMSPGNLQQQAASIVASQLNPQIGAVGQQIKNSQTSEKQSLADIAGYYGKAGSAIKQSQGAVGSETSDALSTIAKLYGAAGAGQQKVYGKAQQGIMDELSRLGLQAAIPSAGKQTASDAQFMEAITRLSGANAQSMAKQMGTNTAGLVNAVASEAAASGAQSKTDLQREMTRAINNLTFQKNMLESTRAGKTQQVLSGLQANAADQAYKNASLALRQQEANARMAGSSSNSDYRKLQEANLALTIAGKKNALDNPTAKVGKGLQAGLGYLAGQNPSPKVMSDSTNLLINASTQPNLQSANDLIAGYIRQYNIPVKLANDLYMANSISWGKG